MRSLKRRKMPKKQYAELVRLLGLKKRNNRECAANSRARVHFQKMLLNEFDKKVLSQNNRDRLDYYLVTFCDDRTATLERNPKADLYAFKEKVRNALRNEPDFEYIGFLDVTSISNFPRNGLGQSILFEIHVFAWRRLKMGEKRRKIFSDTKLRSFKSEITSKPVFVSPRVKPPTPLRALAYTAKAPYWSKRLLTTMNKKSKEVRFKMDDLPEPKTMRLLSIARILSPYLLDDLIIAKKGEGTNVVEAALEKLKRRNPCPPKRSPAGRKEMRKRSEIAWEAAQTAKVNLKYHAPQIRMSRIDPKLPTIIAKGVEPWLSEEAERMLSERLRKETGDGFRSL